MNPNTRRGQAMITALLVSTLAFVLLYQPACHQAIMTAPSGSTIQLFANPPAIPSYGGVSVITAHVMDATGNPVADGTVVQFFTTLGRIDEQGKTNDGVARVNLTADGRSGEATVTAVSGGSVAASATGSSSSSSSSATSAQVKVTIGSKPALVIVVADPVLLEQQRSSAIIANVLDADGNPIVRTPVYFLVAMQDGSPALYEYLDSNGGPIFTDNNGRSIDALRTRSSYDPDGERRTVKVTATTTVGTVSGSVLVVIQ